MLISFPFLIIISILISILMPYWYRQEALRALEDKARSIALIAAHSLAPAVVFEDRQAMDEVFASLSQSPTVDYVLVYEPSGRELARYLRQRTLSLNPDEARHSGLLPSGEHLNQYQPISVEGRNIGYVAIGLSLRDLNHLLGHIRKIIWLSAAALFLLGLVIIYWLSRLVSRPLRQMARTTQEIAAGNYSLRTEVQTSDEVGVLARSFNTMLDELETSLNKLKEARETLETRVEERTRELREQVSQKEAIAQKLKKSEELFRNMVETLGEGVVIVDQNENILFANQAARRIFNDFEGKLEGRNLKEFTSAQEFELVRHQTQRRRQGLRDVYDLELNLADGSRKTVIVNAAPEFSPEGQFVSTLAVMTEITERKKQELALTEAKQKLEEAITELEKRNEQNRLLLEMGDNFQIAGSEEEALEVIKRFALKLFPEQGCLLYLRRDQGKFLELACALKPPSTPADLLEVSDCWALKKSMPSFFLDTQKDLLCPHLKGFLLPTHQAACLPLSSAGETLGLLVFFCCPDRGQSNRGLAYPEMVRQRRDLLLGFAQRTAMSLTNIKLQQSLKEQSIRDPLTGLYNRRYLEETIDRELTRARRVGQPVSVIMADIDHFKKINDFYGHEAGDYVLQITARTLQRTVRSEDIVCRYGGEEFTVIMPGLALEKARARAEMILSSVNQLEIVQGNTIIQNITISAGVSSYPEHGDRWPELIQAADLALLQAKQEGRNRVRTAGKSEGRT